ncbi:hypothetical protein IMZ08_13080 [Bacillus luteolus]|uniref:Uncharacterized protein n=1 Tax=Litchfieldia luteola TaxID=682179 RepID=A0ABR9QKG6_9BACI|nr:hypothetical protein [Cytobacillus luteolus]MBE4908996.1 hypothetical protein [Cytobacillus luteolus]MBP1941855.1 hypothetical protein [Cytobacillus luteolus]
MGKKDEYRFFPGEVVELKDEGELVLEDNRGIIEFSEELSDGGERDEIIKEQRKSSK